MAAWSVGGIGRTSRLARGQQAHDAVAVAAQLGQQRGRRLAPAAPAHPTGAVQAQPQLDRFRAGRAQSPPPPRSQFALEDTVVRGGRPTGRP
jgi:hypothetical protein